MKSKTNSDLLVYQLSGYLRGFDARGWIYWDEVSSACYLIIISASNLQIPLKYWIIPYFVRKIPEHSNQFITAIQA